MHTKKQAVQGGEEHLNYEEAIVDLKNISLLLERGVDIKQCLIDIIDTLISVMEDVVEDDYER